MTPPASQAARRASRALGAAPRCCTASTCRRGRLLDRASSGPTARASRPCCKALAGLLPHDGEVRLQGRPLAATGRRAQRARAAGLAGPGRARQRRRPDGATTSRCWAACRISAGWRAPCAADHAAVERALRTHAGLGLARPRRSAQLSGGERQRVLLARALAVEADGAADGRAAGQPRPAAPGRLAARGARNWSPRAARWSACCTNSAWRWQADQLVVMGGGRVLHHGALRRPGHARALRRRVRRTASRRTAWPATGWPLPP